MVILKHTNKIKVQDYSIKSPLLTMESVADYYTQGGLLASILQTANLPRCMVSNLHVEKGDFLK